MIGAHNLLRSEQGLREHVHAGAMEICYLVKGYRSYYVHGRDYPMRGNDVFVTFPDEPHGSGRHPHQRGQLYWMQVILPKRPKRFLGLSPREGWQLSEELRNMPRRFFRGRREIQTLFEGIFRYPKPTTLTPREILATAARIQMLLLTVVECSRKRAEQSLSPDIQRVLEYTAANVEETISLASLADVAGLSTSRFKAKFRQQIGMPPGEYVLREKIQRAEILLKTTPESITHIAHRLGFSSSQYFATVFKRFTRKRPKEVRAEPLAENKPPGETGG